MQDPRVLFLLSIGESMEDPNVDPEWDPNLSTQEAQLGYIVAWLERIERTLPSGRVGLEPAHRNVTKLRKQVKAWHQEVRALELRLKVPED